MIIKLYNTLSRRNEIFKPKKSKEISFYVCGQTVYNYSHLGHARGFVVYDAYRRFLKAMGYRVKFVSNITDVGHLVAGEDKIVNAAQKEHKTPIEIARFYEKAYFDDLKELNIEKPDLSPRATDYIQQIIEKIKILIQKGYAYPASDGVYFDVAKFSRYGQLSGRDFQDQKTSTRIQVSSAKHHPADFLLWAKAPKEHLMQWDSPWGRGYPGWHIECSVMNLDIFGPEIDIHGGGSDSIFPHHENEIAQSEAITSKHPYVRYWMHLGMLKVNGQKMSKSKGNFITIKDLVKKYDSDVIRYYLLKTHYHKPFDFVSEDIDLAKDIVRRIIEAKEIAPETSQDDNKIEQNIMEALADNFNTPEALNVMIENRQKISKKLFVKLQNIFGFEFADSKPEVTAKQKALIRDREEAREKKDWEKADQIRGLLEKQGIRIDDTKKGSNIIHV